MVISSKDQFAFLIGNSDMAERIRAKDWSQTTIGTPENWPQSLRTSINILLNSQFPMFVWWGEELTTFYNDAYRIIAGEKHPELLGKSGKLAWAEIWSDLEPLVSSVSQGVSTWSEDQVLYMNRHGYIEETYFTFSYSPIPNETGIVDGLFCACIETTEKVLATRRVVQSERNLRNTILQSPVAMSILKGPSFEVDIANDRMYELWGRGAEDILYKPIFEGLPEARHQGLEDLLQNVYHTGETYKASERAVLLPRHGSLETVYLNFVYEPLREVDGTISGIFVVGIDVTEQVIARQQIEIAEERARLAIESANMGTFEVDLLTDKIISSPRLDAIYGVHAGSPRSAYASAILPEDQPKRETAYQIAHQTGLLEYEARVKWPDSTIHWIRVNGRIFKNEEGHMVKLSGVAQDITEEKNQAVQLETLVAQRTEELNRSNQELEQFAHVASHDMKEPIRKIQLFIDRFKHEVGNVIPEKAASYLTRIQIASERLTKMVEGVLNYSTINSSKLTIETIDLNTILKQIENDLELVIQSKSAIIQYEQFPSFEGANFLIYQLFLNLINNSLKFSSPLRKPLITIKAREIKGTELQEEFNTRIDESFVEIILEDNGIGFNIKSSKKIFETFTRLHSRDQYEGTGLGLALVKRIVDRHSGIIYANGEENKGAVFIILFPKIVNPTFRI